MLRFLGGDVEAIRNFWNANIFYPEPLTLAYSEHLFAQAVQILPVYALTGNIILSYNLLFLSTFVLSGLGMFLLVREITGSARAGFVAGLIYAFAPYRVPQFSHVQVLSSQWMPFALYGLRRYFERVQVGSGFPPSPRLWRVPPKLAWIERATADSRTVAPLAGAAMALVAQNLSNGYFLLFFAPFAVAYVLFEIATRKLWKDARVWMALSATAMAVTIVTLPFLLPYLELRNLGFGPRSLDEVKSFSADVLAYWTSPAESRLWGNIIRAYPKTEGELFPTVAALLLAAAGVAASVSAAWGYARTRPTASRSLQPVLWALLAAASVATLLVLAILTGNRFTGIGPFPISARNLSHNFSVLAAILGLLLIVSPRARAFARRWLGSTTAFAAIAAVAAFLMSMGPEIRSAGRVISDAGPYHFFFWHIPGFDGLRVPARFAMLVMLFLSIAAGFGAVAIERRFRRGALAVLALGAFAVAEAFSAPIVMNGTVTEWRYATPPPRVYTGDQVPAVYRFLQSLPSPGTVVAEFPFGEWAYEMRYLFYSTTHWHPLLNGYSGHFPLSYHMNATRLRRPLDHSDRAWAALIRSGATHAIVHGPYYRDDEGERIGAWLTGNGARLIGEFDGDKVFQLK